MIDRVNTISSDILGLDIARQGVMLSCLSVLSSEPNTFSGDNGQFIPLCIAKERDIGRWYVGDNALQRAVSDSAHLVEDLYERALKKESIQIEDYIYSYGELFATYIRRIIEDRGIMLYNTKKLVITLPEVSEEAIELFGFINSRLNISEDVLTIIDHKESFIYYTLSQNQNIFIYDVVLFEYMGGKIYSYMLTRNSNTKPQVVNIDIDMLELDTMDKASLFLEFAKGIISDRVVSSVFLVGSGFAAGSMQDVINELTRGRRVFLGDNLYSKGACFAGKIKSLKIPWNYVYIGDHEMKMNLSLKVNDKNNMSFLPLVNAGENWYETGREYEVILDGDPEFECWIQSPETRRSSIHKIQLQELPKRENRTTRLRISAKPISDIRVHIAIKDLGFGDLVPSSGKMWEHIIDMGNDNG